MDKSKICIEQAGTWFFYYLRALGYLELGDVFNGWISGTTDKEFLGLKNGTLVHIDIDKEDGQLFHVKYFEDYNEDDCKATLIIKDWFVKND